MKKLKDYKEIIGQERKSSVRNRSDCIHRSEKRLQKKGEAKKEEWNFWLTREDSLAEKNCKISKHNGKLSSSLHTVGRRKALLHTDSSTEEMGGDAETEKEENSLLSNGWKRRVRILSQYVAFRKWCQFLEPMRIQAGPASGFKYFSSSFYIETIKCVYFSLWNLLSEIRRVGA